MPFLVITIPWSPNIIEIGPFLLTWHGVFTAVGILGGVQIALWLARRVGYDEDDAYTLALVGVPSGIVGARAMFVAEQWSYYSGNPIEALAIAEGGISVWGAVIGGVLGPLLFAWWRHYPIRRGLDIGGAGLILGMAIGRIGDLINGEHLSLPTSLPWGLIYTHPLSPAFAHSLSVGPHHPATTYEMLGDLVILAAVVWLILGALRRRPGVSFFVFLISYAVMRFAVTYLRDDSSVTPVLALRTPQLVSVIVVLGALPLLVWVLRLPPEDVAPPPDGPSEGGRRAPSTPGARIPVRPRDGGSGRRR